MPLIVFAGLADIFRYQANNKPLTGDDNANIHHTGKTHRPINRGIHRLPNGNTSKGSLTMTTISILLVTIGLPAHLTYIFLTWEK